MKRGGLAAALLCACTGAACVNNLVTRCEVDRDCTGAFNVCNTREGRCQPVIMHHTNPGPVRDFAALERAVAWTEGDCGGRGAGASLLSRDVGTELNPGELAILARTHAVVPGTRAVALRAGGGVAWLVTAPCDGTTTGHGALQVDTSRAPPRDAGVAGPDALLGGAVTGAQVVDQELWVALQEAPHARVVAVQPGGTPQNVLCRTAGEDALNAFAAGDAGILWTHGGGVMLSPVSRSASCDGRTNETAETLATDPAVMVASHGNRHAWVTRAGPGAAGAQRLERTTTDGSVETHTLEGTPAALHADEDGVYVVDNGPQQAVVLSWAWTDAQPRVLAELGLVELGRPRMDSNASRVFWLQPARITEPTRGWQVVSALKLQARKR